MRTCFPKFVFHQSGKATGCYVSDARGLGVLCNAVGFCCVIFLSFFFKFENKIGFEGVRPSLVVSFLTFMCMAKFSYFRV